MTAHTAWIAKMNVIGSKGNNVLVGTNGNDLFYGGLGNDVMKGKGGDDIFVFKAGDGNDRITNFNDGDHLTFSQVSERTVTMVDTANGIKVYYGGGIAGTGSPDSILLVGQHDYSVVAASFVFSDSPLG